MPTEGKSFTNHPGIVDFRGKPISFIITVRCREEAVSQGL
jgi:hypothetical protein